jgi:hypothetical protein
MVKSKYYFNLFLHCSIMGRSIPTRPVYLFVSKSSFELLVVVVFRSFLQFVQESEVDHIIGISFQNRFFPIFYQFLPNLYEFWVFSRVF